MGLQRIELIGLALLALGLGISCLVTPVIARAGRYFGLLDHPNSARKIHSSPIPTTGGFGIFLTMIVVGVLAWRWVMVHRPQAGWPAIEWGFLLAGAAIAFLTGAVDDRLDLRPRTKLVLQLVAAVVAYSGGFAVSGITGLAGETIPIGWVGFLVTIIWFLGCMNAINLLDGMDGLAAGASFFVIVTVGVVAYMNGRACTALLACCLAGAIIGFLFYNFHPASVFLGDAGSTLIGFLVAALALKGSVKGPTTVAIVTPFLALGLPVFDTAAAILRRWARRLPVSAADRLHIHHAMLAVGLSQRRVVLLLYAVCAAFGATALSLTAGRNVATGLLMVVLATMGFFAIRWLRVIEVDQIRQRLAEEMEERRNSSRAHHAVARSFAAIDAAHSVDELWRALTEAFDELGYESASFIPNPALSLPPLSWHASGLEPEVNPSTHRITEHMRDSWSWLLGVQCEAVALGELKVTQRTEAFPIRRCMELTDQLRIQFGLALLSLQQADDAARAGSGRDLSASTC